MKRMMLLAVAGSFSLVASARAVAGDTTTIPAFQDCPAAPAVANAYLRAQAGRRLTMTRANVIAEITKLTGSDGEFAGLRPCDAGYANAVRFFIDEVIKAGTDNSTPQN